MPWVLVFLLKERKQEKQGNQACLVVVVEVLGVLVYFGLFVF